MPTRDHAPLGAPCWADLWTSDVEGSRSFYSGVFGWEAGDPSPEFGGYFMFLRHGVPIAGCMGDMADLTPDDTWRVYLSSADAQATMAAGEANGAALLLPVTPVADLGHQAAMMDPTGARIGVWEAGTFPGFTVLDEPGSPSWFELHSRAFAEAVPFYSTVFGLGTEVMGDSDEFRYTTLVDSTTSTQFAGIMDASSWPAEAAVGQWTIYWETGDVDATVADVARLGGTVVAEAQDTPYGRMATVADPSGGEFRLRTGPS